MNKDDVEGSVAVKGEGVLDGITNPLETVAKDTATKGGQIHRNTTPELETAQFGHCKSGTVCSNKNETRKGSKLIGGRGGMGIRHWESAAEALRDTVCVWRCHLCAIVHGNTTPLHNQLGQLGVLYQ